MTEAVTCGSAPIQGHNEKSCDAVRTDHHQVADQYKVSRFRRSHSCGNRINQSDADLDFRMIKENDQRWFRFNMRAGYQSDMNWTRTGRPYGCY